MHHPILGADIRRHDVGGVDFRASRKIDDQRAGAGAQGGDVLTVGQLRGQYLTAGDVEQQYLGELGRIGEQAVQSRGGQRSEGGVGRREDGEGTAGGERGIETGDTESGGERAQIGIGCGEAADRLADTAGGDGPEFIHFEESRESTGARGVGVQLHGVGAAGNADEHGGVVGARERERAGGGCHRIQKLEIRGGGNVVIHSDDGAVGRPDLDGGIGEGRGDTVRGQRWADATDEQPAELAGGGVDDEAADHRGVTIARDAAGGAVDEAAGLGGGGSGEEGGGREGRELQFIHGYFCTTVEKGGAKAPR